MSTLSKLLQCAVKHSQGSRIIDSNLPQHKSRVLDKGVSTLKVPKSVGFNLGWRGLDFFSHYTVRSTNCSPGGLYIQLHLPNRVNCVV